MIKLLIYALAGTLGTSGVIVLVLNQGPPQRPTSALELYLSQAGAGNVRSVSDDALEAWLQTHDAALDRVRGHCSAFSAAPLPAEWHDGPDGRICRIATAAGFWQYKVKPMEHAGFTGN